MNCKPTDLSLFLLLCPPFILVLSDSDYFNQKEKTLSCQEIGVEGKDEGSYSSLTDNTHNSVWSDEMGWADVIGGPWNNMAPCHKGQNQHFELDPSATMNIITGYNHLSPEFEKLLREKLYKSCNLTSLTSKPVQGFLS